MNIRSNFLAGAPYSQSCQRWSFARSVVTGIGNYQNRVFHPFVHVVRRSGLGNTQIHTPSINAFFSPQHASPETPEEDNSPDDD